MKRFWGFVRKEWFHIIRDKRSLLILIGMPIAQILIFGFAITTDLRETPILVVDPSPDAASRELIHQLDQSEYFSVTASATTDQLHPDMQRGDSKAGLVLPLHLEQRLRNGQPVTLQILTDAGDPNMARNINNYLSAIIRQWQSTQTGSTAPPYQIEVQSHMYFNPELKSVFLFVPGVMTIILMLVSAMMTSISIAREKEVGTMEILLASSLPPVIVIIGKVVPYILLAVMNALLILILGFTVFGMPMAGPWPLLAVELLLFILTSLSLGILISTVSNSQQTAMLISLGGLMLPTILLSGFIFPIESMPAPLQVISHIIPARWFISILKGVMLKGVDITFLWKETLILLGMTLFFLGLSIKRYTIRLT